MESLSSFWAKYGFSGIDIHQKVEEISKILCDFIGVSETEVPRGIEKVPRSPNDFIDVSDPEVPTALPLKMEVAPLGFVFTERQDSMSFQKKCMRRCHSVQLYD